MRIIPLYLASRINPRHAHLIQAQSVGASVAKTLMNVSDFIREKLSSFSALLSESLYCVPLVRNKNVEIGESDEPS